MTRHIEKQICFRCGDKIYQRSIKVENLHKYDTSSKDAYIRSLAELEDVSLEVAKSWAEHGLYEMCKERIRFCPVCGNQLKTWRAKLCLKCGAEFESEYNEKST